MYNVNLPLWRTKKGFEISSFSRSRKPLSSLCEAFIVWQQTPWWRASLFHATLQLSSLGSSQFIPQHSIYPRTKTFPPSLETSPTASARPSAFPVPNRFMLRNKTDGFCSSCPAPPPSPLARARSPLAQRKSSQGRIPNTSETSDRPAARSPGRPLINGRNPRKS